MAETHGAEVALIQTAHRLMVPRSFRPAAIVRLGRLGLNGKQRNLYGTGDQAGETSPARLSVRLIWSEPSASIR